MTINPVSGSKGENTEAYQKETITAEYLGRTKEASRWMYSFANENNPEKPLKFSAFDPNVPKLEEGKVYTFMVQHVPRDDGTFYHNLMRTGTNQKGDTSPYAIKEASPDFYDKSDKGPTPTAAPQPTQRPKSTQDLYWENKGKMEERREARDIAKDPKIVRESCLSSAVEIIKVKCRGDEDDPKTEQRTLKMAAAFAKWCETGEMPVYVEDSKK